MAREKDKNHSTPSTAHYWAKQEADRVLQNPGGVGEDNSGRHGPVYQYSAVKNGPLLTGPAPWPSSSLSKTPEKPKPPEEAVPARSHTPYHTINRPSPEESEGQGSYSSFNLATNQPGKSGAETSSGNSLGWAALGAAGAGVATALVTGGGLPLALIITSAITGVFVAYQYFTRTGLFQADQEPTAGMGQMSENRQGAAPAQQMQAMIDSETSRLQRSGGSTDQPEIEVPSTPKVAKSEQRQGMMPPQGGKTLT